MVQWSHSDPVGLRARYDSALARCDSSQWDVDSVELRGADLRAFVMGTALVTNRAFDRREYTQTDVVVVDFPPNPDDWPTKDHFNAAAALTTTLTLLADGGKPQYQNFVTAGAGQPQDVSVEGWPILVAKIAAHAIWALAACYIAEKYESTIDRLLSRKDAGEKMMMAQAGLLRVVESHADNEAKQGKTLPYSPEEKQVISTLVDSHQKFANKEDPPKTPSPSIFETGTTSLGLVAVIGLLAYFALKGK